MTTKRAAYYTLGCKLNFAESSTIARDLTGHGYERVGFDQVADLYVINTCSVTENADKRFKTIVRKARESNNEAIIIAIGCYAQLKPEELARVHGVDLVLGATEKFNIASYLDGIEKTDQGQIHSCEIDDADTYVGSYSIGDRTRAFLKVQDGCDYKCTYCTIPLARGISRSDTLQNVMDNAARIAASGVQEIVLTGVNIGDYGKGEHGNKRHEHTFFDLVQALDTVDGVDRVRISSIEPNLLKDETIRFIAAADKFVPHFHIPLQSGSPELLRSMKRRYKRELYTDRVAAIRETMPDACIGVDVIVGFPGETEAHFMETYNYLKDLDISYLHVFTYSERANTEAASMPGVVPKKERSRRSKMLRALSAKLRTAFHYRQMGQEGVVLFEETNKEGMISGFTRNYVKVHMPYDPALANTVQRVRLDRIDEQGRVRGVLLGEHPNAAASAISMSTLLETNL